MRRVIVTRPQAQADAWVQALAQHGVPAVALPLLGIDSVADGQPLQQAWADLPAQRLVVFVSANAVQHFFVQAAGRPWPAGVWAGSTGPGTSAALLAAGVPAPQVLEPAADDSIDSEGLWRTLQGRVSEPWQGAKVLVLRGEDGRDWLAERLVGLGAELRFVAAYRRTAPPWGAPQDAVLQAALDSPAQHLWHFSSSQGLLQLKASTPQADWRRSSALATHPRVAAAAQTLGFADVAVVQPGVQALLAHPFLKSGA
jgi:uroporphyrinogen-III synthase